MKSDESSWIQVGLYQGTLLVGIIESTPRDAYKTGARWVRIEGPANWNQTPGRVSVENAYRRAVNLVRFDKR